jgi:WD40 repeat protein
MGVVYKAQDPGLDRLVALKVCTEEKDRARFLREARATAAVHHDHVVAVHAVENAPGGPPYLKMDYIDGPTLRERIAQDRWLPSLEAAAICRQVAEGLAAAHQVHLIHRDIKPGNILLERTTGRAKIVDFGLVRALDQPDQLTRRDTIPGTPEYMSPEQAFQPDRVDGRSDVYGLGVTLYEALTGEVPFRGVPAMVLQQVLKEEPVPPRRLNHQIAPELETICLKALAKEPGRRYQTASALAADLHRFLNGEPIEARPISRVERGWRWCRRNPLTTGLIALAVLLFLVVCWNGYLAWQVTVENQEVIQEKVQALEREADQQQRHQQELRREAILQTQQAVNFGLHTGGWSTQAWQLGLQAAAINQDDRVRDGLAATLTGMDARQIAFFDKVDAPAVAFNLTGNWLIVGGLGTDASILDLRDGSLHPSNRAGAEAVAYRSDGTPLQVVVQEDQSLLIWDVAHQREVSVCRITRPSGQERRKPGKVVLDSDGSLIAAIVPSKEGEAMVAAWETGSGKLLFQEAAGEAHVLSFAPHGELLAAGNGRGEITLWGPRDGKRLATLTAAWTGIRCLAFSPNSRWLAVGAAGGAVTVWDWKANRPLSFLHGLHYEVDALAFSPDGMILATADRERSVKLWDATLGRLVLAFGAGQVRALAFSADARMLAVSNAPVPGQRAVGVWALEYGRGIDVLFGLGSQVARVCLSPDGRFLAALAHNWQVAVWETAPRRLLHLFDVPAGLFADNSALAFSPDGQQLAFAAGEAAKLWDLVTGRELRSWRLPPGLGDCLAFRPSGRELLHFRFETVDNLPPTSAYPWRQHPRVCRLRDLLSANPDRPLFPDIQDFNRRVCCALLAPDGNCFVVEGFGGATGATWRVKTYDSLTGKELWSREPEKLEGNESGSIAIDPTGKVLVYGSRPPDELTLVEMRTGNELDRYEALWGMFSPGLHYRANVSRRPLQPVVGYDIFRGKETTPLVTLGIGGVPSTVGAQFDASGRRFVYGNCDGTVYLCDLEQVRTRLNADNLGLGW